MATRSQISRLASRIEALVDGAEPIEATISVIYCPNNLDQGRVLAKHRQRWPLLGNGRGPVLIVWVSVSPADDRSAECNGFAEPPRSLRYCDDESWREVQCEELARSSS